MSQALPAAQAVHYPDCDGQPMAESEWQLIPMLYLLSGLRTHFLAREDVYVGGDMFLYYEEGNPRVSVAPDAFVVFGVEDRVRMNYKVWEEGKGPDFVLEVASPSTWREDVRRKPGIYAGLGVREYFLFDPLGRHYTPRLRGYRLVAGEYERLTAVESIDRTLTLHSEVLDLDLRTQGEEIRFHDPATGETLLSYDEEHAARQEEAAARQAAELRAEREAAARREEAVARRTAEARVAELEARLCEYR